MSAILLASIAIRVAAFSLSLLLLRRLKDWRIGFLSAMILMMAVRQVWTLAQKPIDFPISFSANIDELPGLAVSVLALLALVFLERMIHQQESLMVSLQDSGQRFLDFARSSGDYFWEMDQNLRFTYFSERFAEVTGVPPEALLGKTREETGIPNVDEAVWRQHLADLAAHRPFSNFVHPRARPDGIIVWLSISGRPVFDKAAEFIGYRGIGAEITERKAMEKEIRGREADFNQLLELVPDAVIIQCDGKIVLANQNSCDMFGASSKGELVGLDSISLVHPDIQDFILDQRNRVQAENVRVPVIETRHQRLDGTSFYSEFSSGPIVWNGQPATISLVRDITERRKSEEQLHQALKMEAVGQLTGGVAHDFNNLLAVILGNADLLADELGDEDRSEIVALTRAAERGAELTHRLLAFSRKQVLEPRATSINSILADMIGLLRRTLGEHIEIETVIAGGLWSCDVDPAQLENAVLNLAINARDAMPDGGKLTIETANARLDEDYAATQPEVAPGQYVMLAVTDTGTGMSPEVREHVFEPFFTTKGVGAGSGLGLSMIYGFVKQSGGHVAIYSEDGEGTTIKLYLPRWLGKEQLDQRPSAEEEPAGRGETVLLVEDDPDVRALAMALLDSLGYRLVEAANGQSALELLASTEHVDILVTDLVLPGGMNGRELAAEVTQRAPGMKVLYMSGYTENAIVHHGRLDADATLLQKPFRRAELARKVRATLDAG